MPASDDRTRMMTAIVAELRLAPSAYYLIPGLIVSPSAGERLAAICNTFAANPDKTYIRNSGWRSAWWWKTHSLVTTRLWRSLELLAQVGTTFGPRLP
jgi:hypothetical protein